MRSDTHYAEMMYGKLSAEYSIAEELTNIKNTLLSTNFVRLVKNCKMEEVVYVVNLKEDTNKICLTTTKIQKNKQSGEIKEKISNETRHI